MTEHKPFSQSIMPMYDVDSSMLVNPRNLSNDNLEEVAIAYADDLVVVRLSDYLDVRIQHVSCAGVLKATREENTELTALVRDEFASDKATSLSVRAMTVMEKGIRKVFKMVTNYRQIVTASKKRVRPRIQLLDLILRELEVICPAEDIDTFLDHLFKEERLQRESSEGMCLHYKISFLEAVILSVFNHIFSASRRVRSHR